MTDKRGGVVQRHQTPETQDAFLILLPTPHFRDGETEAQRWQQFRSLELKFQQTHTLLLEPLGLEQPPPP